MTCTNYAGWTLNPSWAASCEGLILRNRPEFWNLAWLMHPGLDDLVGKDYHPGMSLAFTKNVIDHMDLGTLDHLRELSPWEFMEYWQKADTGDLAITDGLPKSYLQTMSDRADIAQSRLYPSLPANVVRLNARRLANSTR